MSENEFDNLIRRKMEESEEPEPAEGQWESFERDFLSREPIKVGKRWSALLLLMLLSTLGGVLIYRGFRGDSEKSNAADSVLLKTATHPVIQHKGLKNSEDHGQADRPVSVHSEVSGNSAKSGILVSTDVSAKQGIPAKGTPDLLASTPGEEPSLYADRVPSPDSSDELFQLNPIKILHLEIQKNGNEISAIRLRTGTGDSVHGKSPHHHVPTHFSISILASPEFNAVKFASTQRTGVSIGTLFNVDLRTHWTISAGVSYSLKNYVAGPYNYNPSNPAYDPSTIQDIHANCRVLEIPLRLSRKFMIRDRSHFYVGAGLSTYLMLKEKYTIAYNASDPLPDRTISYRNQNKNIFSILVFHGGYQLKLGPAADIGVEPYFKFSLHGVGQGNVPLLSSGASLIVNFNLNPNK